MPGFQDAAVADNPHEAALRTVCALQQLAAAAGITLRLPPPEPDKVTKARVCTNANAMLHGQRHHPLHDVRVARMEAGGDIGGTDEGHDLLVHTIANAPGAKALAHVRVKVNAGFHVQPFGVEVDH